MTIRQILHYPDVRLREKAKPVLAITPDILELVDDMVETMYAAQGCGLAATQLGIPYRIFVVDCAPPDGPRDLKIFINPTLQDGDGAVQFREGCLSFPGLQGNVKRAEWVQVGALNRDGQAFTIEADGILAVAIQHEMDHLDGVLMIDKLQPDAPT